ncbi:ABC transporter, membrane spanning protein (sn-Glycerol-3-phosphate) [Stappia aggregata IAM 12614]|uniref:sn-glycerol-3-phosphate transport system permease protein UgpE n=1 Tax=Roseibium aggregatum (strain ATCC 25650 / DSM 13394 / JCM 20685 / NBRC 16684 / NCIMB 2208 / IAM 12614 / B1) TaxID=384765 RepID=A0NZQ4_ROSAI|nr:ABC transporter permease subunit [Roseibium aggregatum]EAV41621.1 ABC transporter, membrane spanning protein (sn-Glycerol-3-phosphate) [Stappia aggregata IAM 12614] [Roseibium aggregatum IAM 12614]
MPNWRRWHAQLLDHLILIGGALLMTLPVYSIFAATTHEGGRVRPRLDLGGNALENYGNFLQASAGFSGDVTALSMMWNSFLLGAGFATLKVVLSLMTAYALIYFRVRFASAIFAVLLLTLLLPLESRFLPTYAVTVDLGLVNTRAGLILPLVASGLGTLFFRQFLMTVPDALLESARIDGASPLKFFKDILVPLSLPTAAALFLVMFVNGWNQYLWPVIVTSEESTYTLVRGMQFFGNSSLRGLMLAVLAFVPPALLVILFQRQVVKGLFDGSH